MADTSHIAVAGIAAIIAAIFGFLRRKKLSPPPLQAPPENKVFSEALAEVEKDLEEELDRIQSATTGDSPADDLASLGNARRR
jgi:hypothetical protein